MVFGMDATEFFAYSIVLALRLGFVAVQFVFLFFFILYVMNVASIRRKEVAIHNEALQSKKSHIKRVAFFHPFCNSAGGGEKVLWLIVRSLQERYKDEIDISIYTGDTESDEDILKKTKDRFNIDLKNNIRFVRLTKRRLIDPANYPSFTMLWQLIGTIRLTLEALRLYSPQVFCDTTGLAYSFRVVKHFLPHCKIMCYVHYPFISEDMLKRVENNELGVNNSGRIADSRTLSSVKKYYYKLILYTYRKLGKYPDLVYTNSSWTYNHINTLWNKQRTPDQKEIQILYPPCNVDPHLGSELQNKERVIISFAQYRPEKNQALQLDVLKEVLNTVPEAKKFTLHMMGSSRGKEDEQLLQSLKDKAQEMGIMSNVKFFCNMKYSEILTLLGKAAIGIHTMDSEHFGIAVVEMMAAGVVVTAHKSAGPKLDIIREKKAGEEVGSLAVTKEDYIQASSEYVKLFEKDRKKFDAIALRAREQAKKFSDQAFSKSFSDSFHFLVEPKAKVERPTSQRAREVREAKAAMKEAKEAKEIESKKKK